MEETQQSFAVVYVIYHIPPPSNTKAYKVKMKRPTSSKVIVLLIEGVSFSMDLISSIGISIFFPLIESILID